MFHDQKGGRDVEKIFWKTREKVHRESEGDRGRDHLPNVSESTQTLD